MTPFEIAAIVLIGLYGARRFYNELLIPFWGFIRQAVHVTDVMATIPDRLTELERRTVQLTPNGGSHLHDDIRETRKLLELHVADAETWKSNLGQRVVALERENGLYE